MPAIQPAVDAIPWAKPIVHEGKRKQQILVTSLNNEDEPRESIQSYLVKSHQPILYAYQRIPNKSPELLRDGKGYKVFCYALNVVENTSALDLEDSIIATKGGEGQRNIVVIKVLNKSMLSVHPYNGIMALQTLGDDTHVERCLEALEDEKNIYIVTPHIGWDLHSIIPWNAPAFSEDLAKNYFLKMLKSLQYIHQHDVCHRCINTESILLDKNEANALMTNMEMSLRIRKNETTGEYNLFKSMGRYGTLPHMPPEIYTEQDFDGFAADIWSLGVVLFNMLTGEHLYHYPSNEDMTFNHFVVNEGLINDELFYGPSHELLFKMQKVQQLGSSVRNLLHNMLRINYRKRYTIEQIFAHPWVDGIMSSKPKLTNTKSDFIEKTLETAKTLDKGKRNGDDYVTSATDSKGDAADTETHLDVEDTIDDGKDEVSVHTETQDYRNIVDGYLLDFGSATGKSGLLKLNDQGVSAFLYEQFTFVLEVPENTGSLFLYTSMINLETFSKSKETKERALELNFLGMETHGGCLSVDPNSRELLYSFSCRIETLSTDSFRIILENFIGMALVLYKKLISEDFRTITYENYLPTHLCPNVWSKTEGYSHRFDMDNYLIKIGASIGRKLYLNEQGICAFTYDTLTIVVSCPLKIASFFVYATLHSLDDLSNPERVINEAMCLNYLQQQTKGGCISLDRASSDIIFSYTDEINEMNSTILRNILENFIDTALTLRKILNESDTHEKIGSSIKTGAVASASQETILVTPSSTAEKKQSDVAEDKNLNTSEVGSITPGARIPLQSVTDAMESHKYEWSRIPSKMIVKRKYCAIVVVYDKQLGQDKVIVFGGGTDIVECWCILSDDNNKDDSEECWKRLCPMPIALEGCAAVTVRSNDGEDYVYVIGGYNSNEGGSQNSVYRYNVQKDVWERMPDMKTKRSYLACIVKNRIIYAIGGSSTGECSGALDTIEMCNANITDEPNDWVVLNSKMKSKRFKFCACTINPTYAFGGMDENGIVLDTVELNRSIETGGEWESIPLKMHSPRCGHAVVPFENSKFNITGGIDNMGNLLTTNESYEYDIRTNTMSWQVNFLQSNLPVGDGVAATTGVFLGSPSIVTFAIFGLFGFIYRELRGIRSDTVVIRRDTRNILSNQEVTLSILSQLQAHIIENIPRLFVLTRVSRPGFNLSSMNQWSRSLIQRKYELYFVCAEGTGYAGPIEMWMTKKWYKKYAAPALGVSLLLLKYTTRILTGMDLPIGNQMFCLSIQGINDTLNDLLDDTGSSIDTLCEEKLRTIQQCLRTGQRIPNTHVQGLIGKSYNKIAKMAKTEGNISCWRDSMIPVRIRNSNPSIIVWVMRNWFNDPNNNAQDKYELADADEINRQHIT